MKKLRITCKAFETIVPEVHIRREGKNIIVERKGMLPSATDIRGTWQDVADYSPSPIILGYGVQLPLNSCLTIFP